VKTRLLLSLALFSISLQAIAGQFVLLNESEISAVKTSISDGTASKATMKAYKRLLKDANKLLDAPNYTVVDKTIIPPGVTKHDFVSLSSRWWPNENSADGLPWTKEGDSNPDGKTDKVDLRRIEKMAKAVLTLSQAYYFSGQTEYGVKASTMIKVWFLSNKTRMTPHLQYAQTIPGQDKRSSSGPIDGRLIPLNILDSINLLRGTEVWPERFDQVMDQWFATYLKWLTGSKMGANAAKKENRHGSWFYFQTSALAWYLNDKKALARQFKQARPIVNAQFNSKGGQPEELKASKPYSRSCFNLDAITGIAVIAEKANKKFWSKSKPLIKGINYVLPVAQGNEWADQSEKLKPEECIDSLNRYAEYSNSAEVKAAVVKILSDIANKEKKSGDEKRAYARYALLKPALVSQ